MEDFKAFVDECSREKYYLFVKFGAKWCEPCKKLKPHFEAAMQTPQPQPVRYLEIDIDEHDDIASFFEIHSVPQILCFAPITQTFERFEGSNPNGMNAFIQGSQKTVK